MRRTLVGVFVFLNATQAGKPYQADAPSGRWLGNEVSPRAHRYPPSDAHVACPTDFNFCIDTRWSDGQTCLFPNPHLIKRCLDEGCIRSDYGKDRAEKKLEDTYCKDFMSVEGRFCQWTEEVRCSCPLEIEDIVYANGMVVKPGDSVPSGYRIASECVYPSKNIKRMPNGAYVDVPVPGETAPPPLPNDSKLKGDRFWKDPNQQDATLRPMGIRSNSNGVSEMFPTVLAMLVIVFTCF